MKLFQQLLLAPAALGLLAPMAAGAAELNIAGVNRYAAEEQVTSISQFSDVKPTDWAYQALSNLIERYGCVAGYPNGTFKGGQAMTRYEAAALLNACLDRVTEVTDELKRLMAEFEKELAVLKGRVDGLEAKVGELEANQFSTTTKLKGQATFVIGNVSDAPYAFGSPVYGEFSYDEEDIVSNIVDFAGEKTFVGPGFGPVTTKILDGLQAIAEKGGILDADFIINDVLEGDGNFSADYSEFGEVFQEGIPGKFTDELDYSNAAYNNVEKGLFFVKKDSLEGSNEVAFVPALQKGDSVTFNYDVRLNFDTSFTGKDLLRTQLRSGNSNPSAFGSGPSQLEVFADQCDGLNSPNGCEDGVNINRLFYQFPLGSYFKATVGAKVRQDDMLAMWPSAYPADSVLDFFTYAGSPAAYSLNLGAGFGLSWAKNGWSVSAVYVSDTYNAPDSFSGLGEGYTITGQLGYAKDNWGLAFAYTYGSNDDEGVGQLLGNGTSIANFLANFPGATTSSVALSGYWTPKESRWVPSISAGFGYTALDNSILGNDYDMWSWSVGLQWSDVFVKGNNLGLAVGMPTFIDDSQFSSPTMVELWYKFQVTDNISVTPAIFWIQDGGYGVEAFGGSDPKDSIGAVLKTTFKF